MDENLNYDKKTLARARKILEKNDISFKDAIQFAQLAIQREEEEEIDLYSVIDMIKSLLNQKEDRKG